MKTLALSAKPENETDGDLVEKAKAEVNYDNPKWYRNVIFDGNSLNKIAELFPERRMKTDYNAFKLVKELRDNVSDELKKRMKV